MIRLITLKADCAGINLITGEHYSAKDKCT